MDLPRPVPNIRRHGHPKTSRPWFRSSRSEDLHSPEVVFQIGLPPIGATARHGYPVRPTPLEEAVVRLEHSRIHAEDEERCQGGDARLDRID
jgi:hypothetical protein